MRTASWFSAPNWLDGVRTCRCERVRPRRRNFVLNFTANRPISSFGPAADSRPTWGGSGSIDTRPSAVALHRRGRHTHHRHVSFERQPTEFQRDEGNRGSYDAGGDERHLASSNGEPAKTGRGVLSLLVSTDRHRDYGGPNPPRRASCRLDHAAGGAVSSIGASSKSPQSSLRWRKSLVHIKWRGVALTRTAA